MYSSHSHRLNLLSFYSNSLFNKIDELLSLIKSFPSPPVSLSAYVKLGAGRLNPIASIIFRNTNFFVEIAAIAPAEELLFTFSNQLLTPAKN